MPDHLGRCFVSKDAMRLVRRYLLVHHERSHSQHDSLKVTSFGRIAEYLTPSWLADLILYMNAFQDLIELALDLGVVVSSIE